LLHAHLAHVSATHLTHFHACSDSSVTPLLARSIQREASTCDIFRHHLTGLVDARLDIESHYITNGGQSTHTRLGMHEDIRASIVLSDEAKSLFVIERFHSARFRSQTRRRATSIITTRKFPYRRASGHILCLHLPWLCLTRLQIKLQHVAYCRLLAVCAVLGVNKDIGACATVDEAKALRPIEGFDCT